MNDSTSYRELYEMMRKAWQAGNTLRARDLERIMELTDQNNELRAIVNECVGVTDLQRMGYSTDEAIAILAHIRASVEK